MNSTLKSLQNEIGIFLVSLVVSATIIIVSSMYKESAIEDKQMTSQQLEDAKQRYYVAIDRKKLLKEFENRFKQLEKQGVVGDEQRLNWIDIIEETTKTKKIPYVKYKINKQDPVVQNDVRGAFPGIEVFHSSMMLEMQLLHEGDLYTLINQLNAKAKGLFDIENCEISRNRNIQGTLLEATTDRNFNAKCKLNWYTMKPLSAESLANQEEEEE